MATGATKTKDARSKGKGASSRAGTKTPAGRGAKASVASSRSTSSRKASRGASGASAFSGYLARLSPPSRTTVEEILSILRPVFRGADEVISYGILAFKRGKTPLLYVAGWSTHVAIYPVTAGMLRVLGKALTPYVVSRGTTRFALGEPLPMTLVKRMAKARWEEVAAEGAVKASAPKRRSPKKAAKRSR